MDSNEMEICEYCVKDVCNGMGSAEMPITTSIINKFPMAKLFAREFRMHDMDHHKQVGFKLSNKNLVRRMKARLILTDFDGWYFRRMIKRNWYRFVISKIGWFIGGKKGREAYEKGACKEMPDRLRKA